MVVEEREVKQINKEEEEEQEGGDEGGRRWRTLY